MSDSISSVLESTNEEKNDNQLDVPSSSSSVVSCFTNPSDYSAIPRVLLQLIFCYFDAQSHLLYLNQVCSSWHNAERSKDSWVNVNMRLREDHTKLMTRCSYTEWKEEEEEEEELRKLSPKIRTKSKTSILSLFFSTISDSIAAHTSHQKQCRTQHIFSSLFPCSFISVSIFSFPFSITNLVSFLIHMPYLTSLRLYTNHVVYCLALWQHLPILQSSLPNVDFILHISFLPMDLSMDGASFLPSLPSCFNLKKIRICLSFADTDLPHYPPALIVNLYNHFSSNLFSIDLTNASQHNQDAVERLIMRQEEGRHLAIGADTVDILYTRRVVAGPQTLPQLSTLILDGLLQQPTISLTSLSNYMPQLTRLSLLQCRSVNNTSLLSLSSLHLLSYLALSLHTNLTVQTLLEFLSLSPVSHLLLDKIGGIRPVLDCETLVGSHYTNNLSTLIMTGIHLSAPLYFSNNTLSSIDTNRHIGVSFFHSLRTLSVDFPHPIHPSPSSSLLTFLFHKSSFPLLYDCQLICPAHTWNTIKQTKSKLNNHEGKIDGLHDQRTTLLTLLASTVAEKNSCRILRLNVDSRMRNEMINLAPQIHFARASIGVGIPKYVIN